MKTTHKKIPLLAVVGPTASGKTGLAVKLAKEKNGEVISADSMQIYREMQIGTARPTEEEMEGFAHHLLGFLSMESSFSVAQYVKLAHACINEVNGRGKLPILAGGTGLYVSSLLENIQFEEEAGNEGIRKELLARVQSEGIEPLFEELQKIDPDSAARIEKNNHKRVLRALEIYKTTGQTMTQQLARSKSVPSPYCPIIIGLDFHDRQVLYARINRRVEKMVEDGLLEEARRVFSSPYGQTAMGAIGYKELFPWIQGECELSQALEKLKQSTRRYAKRQLTWFRRMKEIHWIFVDECAGQREILEKALQILENESHLWYDKKK